MIVCEALGMLAYIYGGNKAKEIIEFLSDNIIDYLKHSNEIQLFEGLRESIESSVSNIMTSNFSVKTYRHDKKKKFE